MKAAFRVTFRGCAQRAVGGDAGHKPAVRAVGEVVNLVPVLGAMRPDHGHQFFRLPGEALGGRDLARIENQAGDLLRLRRGRRVGRSGAGRKGNRSNRSISSLVSGSPSSLNGSPKWGLSGLSPFFRPFSPRVLLLATTIQDESVRQPALDDPATRLRLSSATESLRRSQSPQSTVLRKGLATA